LAPASLANFAVEPTGNRGTAFKAHRGPVHAFRSFDMLTALVLVCSLAVTPDLRECSRDNAVQVLQVPEEFSLPAMCAMRGQAFLAQTSIGQELASNERVKVMCIRHIPVGRQAA
jgi:hypothetical protein